jgi:hypothetical protein
MSIYATKPEGTEFAKVEPGTYIARCYSMIEIGHVETEFNGEKKKVHKVNLTWELPEEKAVFSEDKGPEPYVVSKTYTLSMHEKATLRKDLESWRGKGFTELEAARFDITKLLGQPCILSIVHQPGKSDPTKTYVVVTSISKLMKGQECPPQYNPTRVLSFDNFDTDVFNSLSDYMKDRIMESDEFKAMQEPGTVHAADGDADDLPF